MPTNEVVFRYTDGQNHWVFFNYRAGRDGGFTLYTDGRRIEQPRKPED